MTMKFHAKVFLIVFTVVVVMADAVVRARDRLSIRVSPATCFAPANLVVRASIEPDASNRAVEVVADSDEFYRSSLIQLEGDQAPRTNIIQFRGLPPGEYEVSAALIGAHGQARAIARAHVNVIESGAFR